MSRRVKMTEDIQKIMLNPKQIRNIGFIGHIDHGKTTLADSLLAEAGLLSETLAGEARVLDYLEEEQRRGITMKSANISLYYEKTLKNKEAFVINLVDTPGHLDFSGKVTRALRLIDGVVVIVDAVEEVSAQTETVLRQALEEAVRPILFINKIDRLFKELKLDNDAIKSKLTRIIQTFNDLIEMYGAPLAKTSWKVSAEKGSVIFGSALHRWGFTVAQMINQKRNFTYFAEKYETNTYKDLVKEYPVWEAILNAVIRYLPNPLEAQKYRISTIWKGDLESPMGKSMINCDPNGPVVLCISKVQILKGRLICTGRVFSGTVKRGQEIMLLNEKTLTTINQVNIFMGERMEMVSDIPAGNIAAIVGIKMIKSGETIIDPAIANQTHPFESVRYVSEPVLTMAVEPEMLKDLNKLQEALQEIQIEDPNVLFEISNETGECLVSGLGPLHLETIASGIKEKGVNVNVSKPTSVFRESIAKTSSFFDVKSPNGLNRIKLALAKLDKKTIKAFRSMKSNVFENAKLREQEFPISTSLTASEARGYWAKDDFFNIIISRLHQDTGVDYDKHDTEKILPQSETGHIESTKDVKIKPKKSEENKSPESVQSGQSSQSGQVKIIEADTKQEIINIFKGECIRGPLTRESLSEIKFIIKELQISSNKDDVNFFELSTMIHQAIHGAIAEVGAILLEPIYKLIISTPPEYIGTVTALVNQFQGKIETITQDAYRSFIEAQMAVRHSIDFSQEVRSQTSGRVFWQSMFESYEPVPVNQQDSIIKDIKFRKGLSFL